MAFPAVRSVIVTNSNGATGTPVVNLPATVSAGDTIFVVIRISIAGAVDWPDGSWNEMDEASPDAADDVTAFAWKKATGSEGGTTITLATTTARYAAVAWAVQGAADPTIRPPEASTVAVGTTGEPDATTCTPTGGAKDYLWLTFFTMEGEQTGITAYPASFTLGQSGLANSGTAGAVTANCTVAGAARQSNAASLDAGVWDVAGTVDDSSAWTVAFHPAEPVPTLLQADEDELPRVTLAKTRTPQLAGLNSFIAGTALVLLNTLAPAQAPFSQDHWPVPARGEQVLVSATTVPVGEESFPAGDPIVPTEWKVPAPRRAPPITERFYANWYMVDETVPFNGAVAPVPRGRPFPIGLRTWLGEKAKASTGINGSLVQTLADATVTAAASVAVTASLTQTLQDASVTASATLGALYPAKLTEWPVPRPRLSQRTPLLGGSQGRIPPIAGPISGSLTQTLQDASVTATATVTVTASLTQTLDNASVTAFATLGALYPAKLTDWPLPTTRRAVRAWQLSGPAGRIPPTTQAITGSLTQTLADATVSAIGTVLVSGSAVIVLEDATSVVSQEMPGVDLEGRYVTGVDLIGLVE